MTIIRLPHIAIAIEWPTPTQLAVYGIWALVLTVLALSVYLALRRPRAKARG